MPLCGDTNLVIIKTSFYCRFKQERIHTVGLPKGSSVFCVPDGAGVSVIANAVEVYGDVSTYLAQARC